MRSWLALAVVGCSSSAKPMPDAPREFGVVSAQALNTHAVAITFTDPPNAAEAAVIANYTFDPALALLGNSTLAGATVTLATQPQQAVTYQLAIAGVTRADDGIALTAATTSFTGHTPFNVVSATSTGVRSVVVAFDAPPDPTEATTLANYRISDPYALAVSGTPQLAGTMVTVTTEAQAALDYDVDVFFITRASDHEPLYYNAGTFHGTDHCADGTPDGDETDLDCGGPTCTMRCTTGQTCSTGTDCASGTCNGTSCS